MRQPMKTIKCPKCNGTGRVPDDRAIGLAMRRLRESKEISLRALARRLEVSAAYLSDLELGRRHWHENVTEAYRLEIMEVK